MTSGLSNRCATLCLGLAMAIAGLPVPVHAQEVPTAGVRAAVCMVRQYEVEGVLQRTAIVVPASDVEAMEIAGYLETPCRAAFASVDHQIAWRDRMCTIAATQPPGIQRQFEGMLGAHPAEFCGMAELVLGPGQRPPRDLVEPEQ